MTLALVAADCPSDGVWPTTATGSTAVANCQGDTVGEMVRQCQSTGSWGEVDTTYCLPKYPQEGYANVDFVLYIMRGNYDSIVKNPDGIKSAMVYAINIVDVSNIAVHRIAANTQSNYVSVQIRVTDVENRAYSFYRMLDEEALDKFLTFLVDNNSERLGLHFLSDTTSADVSLKSSPSYQPAKPKNTTAIVVIVVCVIIGIIVLAIIGFYVWLQIKRASSKNGSKQLKNTNKV